MTSEFRFDEQIGFGGERTPVANGLYRTRFLEGMDTFVRLALLFAHGKHSIRNPDRTSNRERLYLSCGRAVLRQEATTPGSAPKAAFDDRLCPLCDKASPKNDTVWRSQVHMACYCLVLGTRREDDENSTITRINELEIWSFRPKTKNANHMSELRDCIEDNNPLNIPLRIRCSSTNFQNISIKNTEEDLRPTRGLLTKLQEHVKEKKSLEQFCEPPTAEEVMAKFENLMGQGNRRQTAAAAELSGKPPEQGTQQGMGFDMKVDEGQGGGGGDDEEVPESEVDAMLRDEGFLGKQ